ncbi:hypothetical protein [Streptomyces sp. NPDC058758]|uniref:hypothetical protein n=1 Tax=Streptomyces sp. NPDC058758 TaxID=3346627 RepID=UPI0036991555
MRARTSARAQRRRLLALESTEPIAFRRQNSGGYDLPSPRLETGLDPEGRQGFGLPVRG